MYDLDPRLLAAITRGATAQNELQGMNNSAQMAQALRMSGAQMPDMVGEGLASQAPGILNVIANVAQRRRGDEMLAGLDDRAKALRGDISEGSVAQQMMALQQLNQKEAAAAAAKDLGHQRNLERDDTRIRLAASLRPEANAAQERFKNRDMVGPDGKRFNVSEDTKGQGYLGGKLIEGYENWMPYSRGRAGSDVTKLPTVINKAQPHIATIKGIERVRSIADKLTPQDERKFNELAKHIVVNALTPAQLEQYIKNNWMGYSDAAKEFLNGMLAASAKERHKIAGSALTATENMITNAFLPSAEGITLKDRMMRIGQLHNSAFDELVALDEAAGTSYTKKYKSWEAWDKTKGIAPPPPYNFDATLQKINAIDKRLQDVEVID